MGCECFPECWTCQNAQKRIYYGRNGSGFGYLSGKEP